MKSGTIFVLCSWVESVRALFSIMSQRLIGRKLSHTEVSQAQRVGGRRRENEEPDLPVSPSNTSLRWSQFRYAHGRLIETVPYWSPLG